MATAGRSGKTLPVDRTVVRMTPPALVARRRAGDPQLRRRPDPPGTTVGDSLLLAAVARGDESAWQRMVRAHLPSVWAWSLEAAGTS